MHPLEERLGHAFANSSLLDLALTHPSASEGGRDNQRLEFLGDAVLDLVITEELFQRHPDLHEGEMTPLKARLVSGRHLAEVARGLELGTQLAMSPGEEGLGGRERDGALADAFEAVVAALYLDGGFEVARDFVLPLFEGSLTELVTGDQQLNPKGRLQEELQSLADETPRYRLLDKGGPDHDPHFRAEVHWRDRCLGEGRGRSKKAAEVEAARDALQARRWEQSEVQG